MKTHPFPTCSTCIYCRPYHGKSYACALLHEMGLYSHIYLSDPACHNYTQETEQP